MLHWCHSMFIIHPSVSRASTLTPPHVRQIKSMTDRDLARYWAQYVKELAVLLVGLEGGAEAPVAVVDRVRNLVLRELLFLYMRCAPMPACSMHCWGADAP